jgi:hypothetical protein
MQKTSDMLELISQFREFSFKLGKKDGTLVAEATVPPYKPVVAMGASLSHVLETVSGGLRRTVDPHRVIVALDEYEVALDQAVAEIEGIGDESETSFHI